MAITDQYLGNPNLKKAHTPSRFTKKQVQEVMKCLESLRMLSLNSEL